MILQCDVDLTSLIITVLLRKLANYHETSLKSTLYNLIPTNLSVLQLQGEGQVTFGAQSDVCRVVMTTK